MAYDATPHTSALVTLGIPGLALVALGLVTFGIARFADRKNALGFALGAGAWLGISALLGLSGFLTNYDSLPPHLLALMLPSLGLPIWLARSSLGQKLARAPIVWLVGFQAFRLPLELVMHQAAVEGAMPLEMSYAGRNFDILTGGTAIIVAALAAKGFQPRWLLLAWNALGTLLLVNILSLAVAALPLFAAFGREPAQLNTWISYFPFVWLPAGLVSSAVLGHVLLWRRLQARDMRGRALLQYS